MPRMPQVTARELIRFLKSQGRRLLGRGLPQASMIYLHFSHDHPLHPGAVLDVLCLHSPA